jgi:hypothetical protein
VILQRSVVGKSFGKIVLQSNKKKKKSFFFLLQRKYSTAANGLQQRIIDIFYRILNTTNEEYTWATQYGAFIGLCEMSHKVNLLFK